MRETPGTDLKQTAAYRFSFDSCILPAVVFVFCLLNQKKMIELEAKLREEERARKLVQEKAAEVRSADTIGIVLQRK